MASSTSRHKSLTPRAAWVLPTVIACCVAAVITGAYALNGMFGDSEPRAASTHSSGGLAVTAPSTSPFRVTPDQLVDNAQLIKPLEDLDKGDRVLFRERVCLWQGWNKNINTSTITCTGKTLKVATARLTPLEQKTPLGGPRP